MARIRTIKPEFFTSLTVASLPVEARLTFVGLWTHVDDEGRCVDDARLIKAAVWPLDDRLSTDVELDLKRLSESSLILRYKVGERSYLAVRGWSEHQRINRPTKSKIPPPPVTPEPPPASEETPPPPAETPGQDASNPPGSESSEQAHAQLSEDSRQERNREQGTGKGRKPSPPASQATQEMALPDRIDVERVCTYLAEWIVKNGSKRPTITKKWRTDARLLIDKDGRALDEIRDVIAWSQRDPFWRSNILSLPKLREKYDQLRLAMQREQPGTGLASAGQPIPSSISAADGAPLPAGTGNSRMTDAMRLAAHYDALDGTNTISRHLTGA
ncbi:hypothetical protein MCAG_03853 [Micromonospora sp. ATCC 39149]|uniref:hypothetical protein n=1 Tax=Micromonospora sp. (strain ATCC 39149 / NRRL 15099 / SCC 1413) TaxID=219305 RepID=UPI0001A5058E|nr:hypothetical protein [Micromonospora sp. ATCC 39149]EEP73526.1 hypothetical protein MCAG_03853 [Micromonospora sp. ATCC 39149]